VVRYEAILFDFDGVLADTEPLHYASWAEILRAEGIIVDWETYRRRCIGMHDRQMIEFFCTLKKPSLPFEKLWKRYEAKRRLFLKHALNSSPVPPETAQLVKDLRGYKLAVVTSSDRAEVEPVLKHAGVREYFELLVCGGEVVRPKPDPEPYVVACEALGVQRALAVEDSEAGVASARAAGLVVVRVCDPAETARRVLDALRR
jgi:HAD superfamily hydrolase (TIGR01509 family)